VASGFNKRTLISPLHAGLITASIANGGTMMTPWLVKTVRNDAGDVLYEAAPSVLASPINKKTASKMMVPHGRDGGGGDGQKSLSTLAAEEGAKVCGSGRQNRHDQWSDGPLQVRNG